MAQLQRIVFVDQARKLHLGYHSAKCHNDVSTCHHVYNTTSYRGGTRCQHSKAIATPLHPNRVSWSSLLCIPCRHSLRRLVLLDLSGTTPLFQSLENGTRVEATFRDFFPFDVNSRYPVPISAVPSFLTRLLDVDDLQVEGVTLSSLFQDRLGTLQKER